MQPRQLKSLRRARPALWGAAWAVGAASFLAAHPAASASAPSVSVAPTTAWVERPCDIPIASPEVGARLRCGTVSVARDPQRPEEGRFELAVVVKRSAKPQSGAVPVLVLHGGPGGQQTPYMGNGSADIVAGHDSVAFDMRGGGRSTPRFCDDLQQDLLSAQRLHLQGQPRDAARAEALARCVRSFAALGLRPAHFGTERNVADAEAVRQALGIERWAVYSMSYGTTVAAEYAARHPQRLTAVVLDSPYPPDELIPPVRDAQLAAMDTLLAECRTDAACAARFASLTAVAADAALRALAQRPLRFHWQGRGVQADEVVTRTVLHGLLTREATAQAVPWFLEAVVRGDGDAIAAALALPLVMAEGADRSANSAGALLATDCRDRPRHHTPAAPEELTWMELLGGLPPGSCAPWPLGAVPGLPKETEVPMLVLTAAYDGFQTNGGAMAQGMGAKAQSVLVPRASHVVRGAGACPRRLVSDFLHQPTSPLDLQCLSASELPPTQYLLEARPAPAVALAVPLAMAGKPPLPVVGAAGALIVWGLAALLWPAAAALRRRLRAPGSAAAQPPLARRAAWLALAGGVIVAGAIAVPVAGTALTHPGAASFGLHAGLAPWLWGLPVGSAVALVALAAAIQTRRVHSGVAALAVLGVAACAVALGLTPG